MNIIVQKFGGTSVSTAENRIKVINKIKNAIKNGETPIVVVSAIGRKGMPYATDTLLSLLDDNFKEDNKLATDMLISCGELISTVTMSNDLLREGIESIPLTGGQAGIITNNNYNNASVINVHKERIISILKAKKIPVIAGFQGIDEDGFITTLGRGGSDTTASIIGAALNAKRIEIYTDVDGIMTADPRIVPDANLIDRIDYNEIFQFAEQGAKVVHPRAIEIAMRYNIPLMVKNTFTDCNGTMVKNKDKCFEVTNQKLITGITSSGDRVRIEIYKNNSVYNNILSILSSNLINIDLINIFPDHEVFTIAKKDLDAFDKLMKENNVEYTNIIGCSKISIIGTGMHDMPGVMANIVICLNRENINILQTADSNSTIWCLVEEKDNTNAIKALHKNFNL